MIQYYLFILCFLKIYKYQIWRTSKLNGTDYTTGNLNKFSKDNFDFYNKKKFGYFNHEKIKIDKFIIKKVTKLKKFVDNFILDFTNEDPKSFLIISKNYLFILNRRGVFFKLIGIIIIIILIIFYLIRFIKGGCGGFQFEIKNPTKNKKNFLLIILSISFIIFILTGILILLNFDKLNKNAIKLNNNYINSINVFNRKIRKINELIEVINDKKYKIKSFKKSPEDIYHISNKIKFIKLKKKNFLKNNYMKEFKNYYLQYIILIIITINLYLIFLFSFFKSKKYYSWILSAFLLIIIAFKFNMISNYFNFLTLNLDICKEIINYDNDNKFDYVENKNLSNIYIFFNKNEMFLLKQQYLNIIIANFSSYTIIKELLNKKKENFDNIFYFGDDKIFESYYYFYSNSIIVKYLNDPEINLIYDIMRKQNKIVKILNDLMFTDNLFYNKNFKKNFFCNDNLNYSILIIKYFSISIINIIIFWFICFFSENLIKGIYYYKINFINSLKLRHDWN